MEAIESVRKFFNLESTITGSAIRVINLQNKGNDYFLVIFGDDKASVAVAAIESKNAALKTWARLPGTTIHLTINKEKALELCHSNKNVLVEMVWEPGTLSRSQLYPIWKIYNFPAIKYVNQQGVVSESPGRIN